MIYEKGDMVSYKLVKVSNLTYSGVILDTWTKRHLNRDKRFYTVASMNNGMRSVTLAEDYILKKIA